LFHAKFILNYKKTLLEFKHKSNASTLAFSVHSTGGAFIAPAERTGPGVLTG